MTCVLIAIDGYVHKQSFCSCGWSGRRWPTVYTSDWRGRRHAKREWKAHRV